APGRRGPRNVAADARIVPDRFVTGLARLAAGSHGGQVRSATAVTGFRRNGRRVVAVLTSVRHVPCDSLWMARGAYSRHRQALAVGSPFATVAPPRGGGRLALERTSGSVLARYCCVRPNAVGGRGGALVSALRPLLREDTSYESGGGRGSEADPRRRAPAGAVRAHPRLRGGQADHLCPGARGRGGAPARGRRRGAGLAA